MAQCNSCGDEIKAGLWENHTCVPPTQTEYDDYANNDDFLITVVKTDYADKMKEILVRIQDGLEAPEIERDNLINLIKVAKDYLFYLEDNRRVII
jgi:hypothetical protein